MFIPGNGRTFSIDWFRRHHVPLEEGAGVRRGGGKPNPPPDEGNQLSMRKFLLVVDLKEIINISIKSQLPS